MIEYNNNYSDTSGGLWQFKRDESPNGGDSDDFSTGNSASFKYKSSILEKLVPIDNGVLKM